MTDLATKKALRTHFDSLRQSLTELERLQKSAQICAVIGTLADYRQNELIGIYAADQFEVDLRALFEMDKKQKRFFLPRYRSETHDYTMVQICDWTSDLQVGKYGLPEPRTDLPAATEDELKNLLYLTPGVAFDATGARLGRGGGFYDRLLANTAKPAIGVFFDCQTAGVLPTEEHDRPLSMAVTESGVHYFLTKKSNKNH